MSTPSDNSAASPVPTSSWASLAAKTPSETVHVTTNQDQLATIENPVVDDVENYNTDVADGDELEEGGDMLENWAKNPFLAFKQGVAVSFYLWQAFQLILQQPFVDDVEEMSDVLESDVIEVFIDTKGNVTASELEDWLQDTILENFNVYIEDGSCREIANLLVTMYNDVVREKNFDGLCDLMERAVEHEQVVLEMVSVSDSETDYDEDGEEDEDEDDEPTQEENNSKQSEQPQTEAVVVEQLVEQTAALTIDQPTPQPDALVEDDGWTNVKSTSTSTKQPYSRSKKTKKGKQPLQMPID